MAANEDVEGLLAAARVTPGADGSDAPLRPRVVKRRVRAIDALARLDDPRVEDGVRLGLADPSPEVREAAVAAVSSANLTGLANGLIAGLIYWEGQQFAEARAATDRVLSGWELTDMPERLALVLAQNGNRDLEGEHTLLLGSAMLEDERELGECQESAGNSVVGWLADPASSMADAERAGDLIAFLDGGGVDALADLLWTPVPSPASTVQARR